MEIKIDIKITCPAIQASIVWTITLAFKYIQELKLYIFDYILMPSLIVFNSD